MLDNVDRSDYTDDEDDVDEDDDDDFMMLRPFQYNNYLKEILSCLIVPHLYSWNSVNKIIKWRW